MIIRANIEGKQITIEFETRKELESQLLEEAKKFWSNAISIEPIYSISFVGSDNATVNVKNGENKIIRFELYSNE